VRETLSTIAVIIRIACVAEFAVAEVAAERVDANCIFSAVTVVDSALINVCIQRKYCFDTRIVSKITSSKRHVIIIIIIIRFVKRQNVKRLPWR